MGLLYSDGVWGLGNVDYDILYQFGGIYGAEKQLENTGFIEVVPRGHQLHTRLSNAF